jgi:2-oxoglutarate dehydrogenase E2 component (dihydrolipoamide succinyltransferase)
MPAMPVTVESRREERVRMSRRRQTIAKRLVEAQHNAAMLTTFNEIDMSAVMEVRKRRRDAFKERYNVSLGYMSFFTKAVIGALKAFPRLNAEVQGDEMLLKRYYDIGIAVGVEEGLVVPVLRDVDRMSFAEIERQIAVFAEKARKNQLTLDEIRGGTFTISNGGIFGSLLSTPILNGPQVGILGMHKIQERPIAVNGQVVIHPMMYVALSYDHRIVDGNEAVRFLVRIKELVEDPETLLLEG